MRGRSIVTMILIALLLAAMLGGYALLVAGAELAYGTRLVIRVGTWVLVAAMLVSLAGFIWLTALRLTGQRRLWQLDQREAHERFLEAQAKRRLAERDADLMVIKGKLDEQLYLWERGTLRPIYLESRSYANGVPTPPSPLEVALWYSARQKQNEAPPVAPPLPQLTAASSLPERVELFDLLFNRRGNLKRIVLGVRLDEHGQLQPVSAPMYRLCHIGAAGATDSGKSNFGRVVAYQVMTAVDDVQVVISDLKATTFKAFSQSRRLLYPIIHTSGEFVAVMAELSDEMSRRKELFKPHPTVETLLDYNRLVDAPLPVIVVFIDEISNLFLTRDTQDVTLEMLREARAFGMYFVAMGQSWSHREMNTSIRQQFRTGLHFGTNDPASSRMIVNSSDAAKIMVPGRALASLPFGMAAGAVELQTPYLDAATTLHALHEEWDEAEPASGMRPMPPAIAPGTAEPADEPTEKQAQVLAMWDEGITDKRQISREVYGRAGGKQYDLIQNTLAKFGRI